MGKEITCEKKGFAEFMSSGNVLANILLIKGVIAHAEAVTGDACINGIGSESESIFEMRRRPGRR